MSGKFIDAYSVLQIGSDADDAAVRARHRELAKQFHPDRGGRAADGELMMRINRARDVLLDPVARAILDEELARRRRESTRAGSPEETPAASPGPQSPGRDRRWRAEWGTPSPWATPPTGSAAPGPVPPPAAAPVRPSVNRLRHASRQARAASTNPALSARRRAAAASPPPQSEQPQQAPAQPTQPAQPQRVKPRQAQPTAAESELPRRRPAKPQRPARAAVKPQADSQASSQAAKPTAPPADKPAGAWSLYSVPLDGVSVAAFVASVIMCGPLGFVLGIIGLARTADDKRRGRWAAVAGIAISSLTMLVAIGYVMQAMSSPVP